MNKLLALADRVEKLTGPDREVMYEAFDACMSRREPSREGVIAWSREWLKFEKLISVEAWVDAAMILASEPFDHIEAYPPRGKYANWTVHIILPPTGLAKTRSGYAVNYGLAIVAAALRARAHGGGE